MKNLNRRRLLRLGMASCMALVLNACDCCDDGSELQTTCMSEQPKVVESATVVASQQPTLTENAKVIYFDFDKQDIRPGTDADNLQKQIEFLRANPQSVMIEGHTDDRGTQAYNLGLGERRARTVKQALEAGSVPASSLDTRSYGKSRLAVPNAKTEAEHQQNRRAVSRIVGG